MIALADLILYGLFALLACAYAVLIISAELRDRRYRQRARRLRDPASGSFVAGRSA